MKDYQMKIKQCYPQLSRALKKVADFLLEEPNVFAVKTAGQVGKEIGVSETTVIRFTYALGYQGYSELQKEIQKVVFEMKSSLDTYQRGKCEKNSSECLFTQVMNQDRENILITHNHINTADFHKAVDKLTAANKILAAGVRLSHAMAHWFTFTMDIIRGNVSMFRPDTDDAILRVSELDEQSVFVAFSFHRYAAETIKLAQVLREKGVFVIGITDSPVAPIGKHADLVLLVNVSTNSTLDVAPACFSLLNSLCSAVTLKMPEQFEERRQRYELESQRLKGLFQ